jgi:hypothetical protein
MNPVHINHNKAIAFHLGRRRVGAFRSGYVVELDSQP